MEAAESDAVIKFDAAIGDVDGVQRRGKAFAEIFAERKIESRVPGQISAGIRLTGKCIGESGAVINIGGSVGVPGKSNIAAEVEGVALIVIERRESGGRGKIGETAGDGSAALGNLLGSA